MNKRNSKLKSFKRLILSIGVFMSIFTVNVHARPVDIYENDYSSASNIPEKKSYTKDDKKGIIQKIDVKSREEAYSYEEEESKYFSGTSSATAYRSYDSEGNYISHNIPDLNGTSYSINSDGYSGSIPITSTSQGSGTRTENSDGSYTMTWSITAYYSGTLTKTVTKTGYRTKYDATYRGELRSAETIEQSTGVQPQSEGVNEPVNIVTGNYYVTTEDLKILDVGLPIAISRYYSSLDQRTGVFGKSWRMSFETSLEESSSNNRIKIIFPDGHAQVYNSVDGIEFISDMNAAERVYKKEDNSYNFIDKNDKEMNFNGGGQLVKIADENGNQTIITYDERGNLQKVEGKSGKYIKFEISDKLINALTDNLGRRIEYKYDSNENLVEVKNPEGGIKKYTYSPQGLASGINELGQVYISNEYDEFRRIVRQVDSEGTTYTYNYDDAKLINSFTNESTGTTIEYHYDEKFYITKKVYDDKSFEAFEYDEDGNRTEVRDRNGNITKFEFDENRNLVKRISPAPFNYETIYEYDSKNNLMKILMNGKLIKRFSYDSNGNIVEAVKILSDDVEAITRISYDLKGRAISIVDPENNKKIIEYGVGSHPIRITDSEGISVSFEYDEVGRKIADVNDLGRTEYIYDKSDKLIKIITPAGNTTRIKYDIAGNITEIINPNQYNNITDSGAGEKFIYDKLNRLTESIDPLGNKKGYTHDGESNIIKEINENDYNSESKSGVGVEYIYDNERLVNIINQLGHKSGIKYDANGNIVKIIDFNNYDNDLNDGVGTEFVYDELNRTTIIKNAEGIVVNAFIYDSFGNVSKSIDAKGYLSGSNNVDRYGALYKYNRAGWLIEKREPIKQESGQIMYSFIRYAYNKNGMVISEENSKEYVDATGIPQDILRINYYYYKNGKLKEISDSTGGSVKYFYDGLGRKSEERLRLSESKWSIRKFKYDADGNLKNVISVFDGEDLVDGGSGEVESTVAYEYDKNGNIISITYPYGFRKNFEYDSMDRLIQTTEEVEVDSLQVNGTKIKVNTPRKMIYPGMEYEFIVGIIPDGGIKDLDVNLNYDSRILEPIGMSSSNNKIIVSNNQPGRISIEGTDVGIENENAVARIMMRVKDVKGEAFFTIDPLSSFKNSEGESFYFVQTSGRRILSQIPDFNGDKKVLTNDFSAVAKMNDLNASNKEYKQKFDFNGDESINKEDLDYVKNWLFEDKKDVEAVAAQKEDEKTFTANFKSNKRLERRTQRIVYDKVGNIIEEIDYNGNSSRFKYDSLNRPIKIIDNDGSVTRFVYDKNGNVIKIISAENYNESSDSGTGTEYKYDTLGRVTSILSDGVVTKTFEYDNNNNKIREIDAEGHAVEYVYDIGNRQLSFASEEVNAIGKYTTQYSYDAKGNVMMIEDAEGNITRYIRDEWGRATSIIDAEGIQTQYEYDIAGNIVASIDGKGNRTEYIFNSLNKVKKIIDSLGKEMLYKYDREGNLRKYIDRKGILTKYSYNNQGQLKNQVADGNEYVEYFYNKDGSMLGAANINNVVKFDYNENYNLTSKWRNGEKLIDYDYDKNGNIVSVKDYFSKKSLSYIYDSSDRLITVKEDGASVAKYNYNLDGTVRSKIVESGLETEYTYDKDNRVKAMITSKNGENVLSFQYEYYSNGFIKSETDNSGETSYVYDKVGRLTNVNYANGDVESYAYDKSDNRISKTLNGAITEYSYDTNNRLLEFINNGEKTTFSYDSNGNMLSEEKTGEESTIYKYNNFNQLIEVVLGEQYQKNYYEPTGLRSSTIENGVGFEYNYSNESLISERNTNDEITFTARGLGLISQTDNDNNKNFYLQNLHGDVKSILNTSGNTVNLYEYDSFGSLILSSEKISNRLKYSGEQYDNINGEYYLRARYYDPSVGRFTQEDTFRGGGLNLYIYVGNNSINFTDSSGEWIQALVGAGIGAVAGLASRVVTDIVDGKLSSPKDYVIDTVAGAVGGAVTSVGGPMAGTAAASVVSRTMNKGQQYLSGEDTFDIEDIGEVGAGIVQDVTVGWALGKVGKGFKEKIVNKVVSKLPPVPRINRNIIRDFVRKTTGVKKNLSKFMSSAKEKLTQKRDAIKYVHDHIGDIVEGGYLGIKNGLQERLPILKEAEEKIKKNYIEPYINKQVQSVIDLTREKISSKPMGCN